MSIRSSGEFIVPGQRPDVHAFLTDPNKFAPLLPDFKSLEIEDEKSFVVKLRVGVSNIRGTALIRLELFENKPPEKAVFKGSGKLPGGAAELTAQFDLEETSSGTKVHWQGEAQIVGKIASIAGGLLEPLAQKNLQRLIDGLQSALSSKPTS